jgi:hypothetical protein
MIKNQKNSGAVYDFSTGKPADFQPAIPPFKL